MTVTNEMQPTMPTGMSKAGFLTSSAMVDTQSKPMKLWLGGLFRHWWRWRAAIVSFIAHQIMHVSARSVHIGLSGPA